MDGLLQLNFEIFYGAVECFLDSVTVLASFSCEYSSPLFSLPKPATII